VIRCWLCNSSGQMKSMMPHGITGLERIKEEILAFEKD
jgi:hypothetical protein